MLRLPIPSKRMFMRRTVGHIVLLSMYRQSRVTHVYERLSNGVAHNVAEGYPDKAGTDQRLYNLI